MAIEERKTKAERRAEARAERKRAEEQARKQTTRRNFTTAVGIVVILAFVGGGLFFALDDGGADPDASVTVSAAAVEDARAAVGCETLVEDQPLDDATHWDVAEAPPADTLYAAARTRPTNSGPHYQSVNPPLGSVPSQPIDERAVTHNLEHGAVVVWFDPEQVDDATVDDMEDWMSDRQAIGFETRSGGNVFVTPATNISSGKAIALRAWGQSVDCDGWDRQVADSFVIDHWGTHGIAPERTLSPYPEQALGYEDQTVTDNTEAPTTDRHDDEDPDVGTESESPADTETGG